MTKSEFIRSLQYESKALSPFDISQRLRQAISCVCVYQGDPDLDIEKYRGYMVRFKEKPNKSPENPELYICVVSLRQPKSWQDLVWAKEILHILDSDNHRTASRIALGPMLDSRDTVEPHTNLTPLNVMADKNGFTLALGCLVPLAYRESLRRNLERPAVDQLEGMLSIPKEFIEWLLSDEYEDIFDRAVLECDH